MGRRCLLQGSGPQVYVMAGCQRHWIPDPDTFNAHGYKWDAIQHVSDADLTAIAEGAQLPPMPQPKTVDPQLAQLQQQLTILNQQQADIVSQMAALPVVCCFGILSRFKRIK